MNTIEMNRVKFKDDIEALEKLKEIGFFTKTKTVSSLSKIVYKEFDSQENIISHSCKVLGFNWKYTPEGCINKIYQNLTVEVEDKIFDINIEYLKDMQKKSWGAKEFEEA